MKRIKVLDSFRGLAALVVVFHHVYTRFTYLYPDEVNSFTHPFLNFISELNLDAVLFFFILSGFSIRLSLKAGVPITRLLLNEYLYRRFKRILPLYIVALSFTFICGVIIHQILMPEYSVKNLLGNMFFLQISTSNQGYWFSPYGGNGPLWSLSFEMFYYLFFPVFIFILMKIFNRGQKHFYLFTLIASFLVSVFCIGLNKYFFFPYIAFAALFFIWYSGYFIAEIYLTPKLRYGFNLFVFIVFYLILQFLSNRFPSSNLDKLSEGALFSIVFITGHLLRKKVPVLWVTNFEKWFNFLFYRMGTGSFALYLLHYPVILVLMYFDINLSAVIVTMVILIYICTSLEDYFVRKKFLFLKRSYF